MDPVELSLQLKKPTGENGLQVAENLNESNQSLYDLALELIDVSKLSHLVEIGFGNGKHFSKYFKANPELKLTGVDYSNDMCREAKSLNRKWVEAEQLSIHCTDSSFLPLSDRSADTAIVLNVVYFWDEPGTHFSEIKRVLKPGAKLVIGYRPKKSVQHYDFTRQNFILYEPEELHELISNHGFEIIRHEIAEREPILFEEKEIEVIDACIVGQRPI